MNKRALIIGATSSLAARICHRLAEKNYKLFLVARDAEELEIIKNDLRVRYNAEVITQKLDLSYITFSAAEFVQNIEEKFRFPDSVFMVAGDMGAADAREENIERVTKINYLQPAKILEIIAEKMGNRERGRIIVISSVAGDRGRASNYIYGSAKAALSTFASGLRNKFSHDNVHIMTVKPGFLDTPMTYGMHSPLIWSRDKAAKTIIKAMRRKREVIYVPFFWRYIMLIIKLIPEKIFKRLNL